MNQLTITEFVQQNGKMDQIYIDKFWDSISDDKWVYVDNELLEWMGYETNDDPRKLKKWYMELLTNNFTEHDNYQHVTSSEIRTIVNKLNIKLPENINSHNRTMHIVIDPDCFKESLMLMNTEKAKIIRRYYIQLEKIFKAYMKYCNDLNKNELEKTKQQLVKLEQSTSQFKLLFNKKNEHKLNQFIYVATSHNYAKQCIFKIGMTKSVDKRILSYQTGRVNDDKFVYVCIAKCVDCRTLEAMIQSRLDQFRHEDSRELFQIHFEVLKSIIDEFTLFEQTSTPKFNNIINSYYKSYADMKTPSLDELAITDYDEYMNNKYHEHVVDVYKSPTIDPVHPLSLTDEEINKRLEPHGISLKEPYNGRGDVYNTFQCNSVLKHTIISTYENIYKDRELGCVYCRKVGILDQVPIYKYTEHSYQFVYKYNTFDELKKAEPMLNHQLLKNIIREQRWLTTHYGNIYSILAPNDDNKLSLMKPLIESEKFIIDKLEIDYELMRTQIMRSAGTLILAIDEKNDKAYSGTSATEFSKHLCYVGSSKRINRKTLVKFINSEKSYGGYKWIKSLCARFNGRDTINVATLPLTN